VKERLTLKGFRSWRRRTRMTKVRTMNHQKKAKPKKHMGTGFGKHSTKTRAEVHAEHTMPKEKV
jgi:hypothetical protein